jgi:hypothetical protein
MYNDGGTAGMVFSMNPSCGATGKLFTGIKNGGSYQFSNTNEAVVAGAWNYVASTMTGSGNANNHMYINGPEATYSAPTGTPGSLGTPTANLVIGDSWPGPVDEVRVSSVVRSADWIKTTYNTELSPSEFSIMYGPSTGARIAKYIPCTSAQSVANVCTFTDNVTSGNLIVIVSEHAEPTNCTIGGINSLFSDTRSTTFSFAVLSFQIAGGAPNVCIAFGVLGSSGSETVTSVANINSSQSMVIYEIAGISSPSLDVTTGAIGGAAGSLSTGSATATTANSLLICGFSGSSSAAQFYTSSLSPTGMSMLNYISAPILGATRGGTAALLFTGSGSKSCTFTFGGPGPTNTAVALAVIKFSPSSGTKRRLAQVY